MIDLSSGGLRVLTTRSIRGDVSLRVESDAGDVAELHARVIWSRRVGFRRYVTGLSFVDLTPETAQIVAQLESEAGAPDVT